MDAPRGTPIERTIAHVDLDAFYASVEQLENPALAGRPVIVGGSEKRGVVAAASYEARPYGVRSAMPTAEARRRCPHAVLMPPRMARYAAYSEAFFAILDRFAPRVEGLSLDEAFLDISGQDRLFGGRRELARRIAASVSEELGLSASVGVAPTKFAAKIASDIDKPGGLRVVDPEGIDEFLAPLPVSRLWGAGPVTERRLRALGLRTLGDVAARPPEELARCLGRSAGLHFAALARGRDDRDVEPESEPISLGHEETFDDDATSREALAPILHRQADRVAARLRRRGLRASTVTLKLKYADFRVVTRRRGLPAATADGAEIGRVAVQILADLPLGPGRRARLAGVSASGLESRGEPSQLSLFGRAGGRGENLGDALDRIEERFGRGAVARAAYAEPKGRRRG